MNRDQRIAYAEMALRDLITDNAHVNFCDKAPFLAAGGHGDLLHRPLGFFKPHFLDPLVTMIWIDICPEIVVDTTLHLEEPDFHDHILTIGTHCNLHIINDNEEFVERELMQTAPASFNRYMALLELAVDGSN